MELSDLLKYRKKLKGILQNSQIPIIITESNALSKLQGAAIKIRNEKAKNRSLERNAVDNLSMDAEEKKKYQKNKEGLIKVYEELK